MTSKQHIFSIKNIKTKTLQTSHHGRMKVLFYEIDLDGTEVVDFMTRNNHLVYKSLQV